MDLLLDETTHDLKITKGDLSLNSGIQYVIQLLKIRLQFFAGEWFLDTTKGLPFFEEILIKNPDVPSIESLLKASIIETDGVLELIEFSSVFSASNRSLSVEFKVTSIYGDIELNQTIFEVN